MNSLTVKELCTLAGVSRSGYYRWLKAAGSRAEREKKDRESFTLILQAYRHRGFDKGVRGIHMRLLHTGVRMNTKKIRRLMRKYGLYCPIRKANPYRRMAAALQTDAVAENKVSRQFKEHGPRSVLLTDITYLPCCGGFCYLSVIKDACTQQVLAYELSESLEVDFVLETIRQLVRAHGASLHEETMIHSDQGCHYTSIRFRELVQREGLIQSMSRRGNCWDNAPQESFFGHMKDELGKKAENWKSFSEVKADIDDWMDYYNNERYQWNICKLSPNEYYTFIMTGISPITV